MNTANFDNLTRRHSYAWAFACGAAVGALLMGWICRSPRPVHDATTSLRADTVVVRDTIRVSAPRAELTVSIGNVTRRMPMAQADTLSQLPDSVDVAVEMQRTLYSGDGWRAQVSGYEARLDSLWIERADRQITLRRSDKRWCMGVGAGVGVTRHGVEPGVWIGVSYRLFSF